LYLHNDTKITENRQAAQDCSSLSKGMNFDIERQKYDVAINVIVTVLHDACRGYLLNLYRSELDSHRTLFIYFLLYIFIFWSRAVYRPS